MAHWLRVSYPPLICARVHRATMLPLTRRSSFIDLVCLSPFPHPSTSSSAGSNAIIVCLPCLFVSRSTHRRRGGVRRGTTNNKRSFAPTQRTRQQRTQTDRQTANQPTNERTNERTHRAFCDHLATSRPGVWWCGQATELKIRRTNERRTTNDERRTTNDDINVANAEMYAATVHFLYIVIHSFSTPFYHFITAEYRFCTHSVQQLYGVHVVNEPATAD